ncbi:amidase family protein [Salinactinospora qingdaonensis]|uniref:Amidase n=1 Tax=Salinactinospora qingdaonensis TaxID=702744 RepID=A0ABP7FT66_9ACTN
MTPSSTPHQRGSTIRSSLITDTSTSPAPQPRPAAGALALGEQIATGRVDAVEHCAEALEQAAAAPTRHAFILLTRQRAESEAAHSQRRHRHGHPRGPLDGVPLGWKDLFDVVGTPTTAGSATRRSAPAATVDAGAVANATAAGMVCLGKTNLSEFAYSGLGLNPTFGTPANPLAAGAVPGGSSSGSAVAVATGTLACAVGTDTSGSVRVPAALCGVVGFAPTSSRISRTGVFPLAPTLDRVGPITRTVADAVTLEAVLGGRAPAVPQTGDLPDVEVVVPAGALTKDLDSGVAEGFNAALDRLERAGVRIRHRPMGVFDEVRRLFAEHGALVSAEAYRTHAHTVHGAESSLVDPRVLDRLAEGEAVLRRSYGELLGRRESLCRRADAMLHRTVVVYPTVPIVAPRVAAVTASPATYERENRRVLRNTMITSFLNLPSLTLPTGSAPAGAPVGLSISGASHTDDRLLACASAIEWLLAP